MPEQEPIVGVTMGEPAGIGREIITMAYPEIKDDSNLVVLGDVDAMRDAASILESSVEFHAIDDISQAKFDGNALDVLHFDNVNDIEYGEVRSDYGQASLDYVEHGIDLALSGEIDAMCNAPINKEAMIQAGSEYTGHTGLLAERTNTEDYAMMLIQNDMYVTLVTAHMPLSEACEIISTENVLETIRVTHKGLRGAGMDQPRIAVAGLNPHAGEAGVLGNEDEDEIRPAINAARNEGIDADGPLPGDSVFNQLMDDNYDCVVGMYHDQGHIPMYVLGYIEGGGMAGAGMTLGLPIVRTTTMHGTAFDIAGEGIAAPDSMIDAINAASNFATPQN
jgi:4-hydroxythreonine-4-phosphate dehydrogenase